ncbi:right-handed parallel beta-helix repeat-containing protein [Streptomyces yanii]
MRRPAAPWAFAVATGLAAALLVPAFGSAAEAATTPVTLYAAPDGEGTSCTQTAPCSLSGAQTKVREAVAGGSDVDVDVKLLDGTYRLGSTWKFGAQDSGTAGHPVVWEAADGARPVISGATRIHKWTESDTEGLWSASVPAGSDSRQLYVDGRQAPVAQATAAQLGFSGSWTGTTDGYNISGDSAAKSWFGALSADELKRVEFDYPGGNGPWTESRCRVAGYDSASAALTMTQPCWTNTTRRASFSHASGGLPSMNPRTKPSVVANAKALIRPGQWYLDPAASKLYYKPLPGESLHSFAVELPRLESLLQGAGTLGKPVHDLTFKGLQFSHATWNGPSSEAGFSDVQSNLRMTEDPAGGSTRGNQAMCEFSAPAGSCPWGGLTQPQANVAFSAARNVTLTGNRFAELGGAGLSVMYGSVNTRIQGNEFTDIASTGLLLGCTYDPTPVLPVGATSAQLSPPEGIKQNCTPDPAAVGDDIIGANEILTDTTVSDNIIHRVGTDYSSACGITLLFSRGTTITHNNLYDLPYTGITAGVIQGHVDHAGDAQNSVNINENNTISNNLIHDWMKKRHDGGAIYVEGHQAQYRDVNGNAVPATGAVDSAQTLAHGLQVKGNVAYQSPATNFTYYDDAGSEWINWQGNVAFNAGNASQGGCSSTGHFWISDNYFSRGTEAYACARPIDSHVSNNTSVTSTPAPDDLSATPTAGKIPESLFTSAGVSDDYAALVKSAGPTTSYVSAADDSDRVLVAGEGFGANPKVYAGSSKLKNRDVRRLSSGFLIATVPAGTRAYQVSVGRPVDDLTLTRVNDTDSAITYSGFSTSSGRGLGDFLDDIHYATANGSKVTYTFTGTSIKVYGELNSDQGNLGVTLDNQAQQTVATTSDDGERHTNAVVFSADGLSSGTHTIVIEKLSGSYATFDGFSS